MNLRQNEQQRTRHASAKLNLFLDVLDRRDDGYHELETLMVPVDLYDSLTMIPLVPTAGHLGSVKLTVRGSAATADIPTDSRNLVVRALELLRQRSGCELGADVELVKRIPSAAGLGGGSSDAATALELGNQVWGIGWSRAQLAELAAELGSDVPFFLAHGAAICRGRGEHVQSLGATAPLDVVIVKPPTALGTAEVYRALDQMSHKSNTAHANRSLASVAELAAALRRGTLNQINRWMGNRLEAAAATLSPWVGRLQSVFAEFDCLAHQLTGSGSAYFGVCRNAQHARRLATILRMRQIGFVYAARCCH
jgi:4-diphosphocytidyl-2-C-methyl-D-erythritol kinase